MSIRHLDHLFDPAAVAVIGASSRPHSVGAMVWQRLREGGFSGPVWPVNPKHTKLDGQRCFPHVDALPGVPDLAVICTPAATVLPLIEALARKGTKAAVVLTAGLDAAQKQAMLDAARPTLLRILGPNGIGLLVPRH
ncbi:MAG: CoA-binding protein, partial [Rubrivivax sp.]